LTAGTETQKVYSIGLGEHTAEKLSARLEKTNGAGLFDTLTGDVTLSNLTLKDPVITAAQGMNVGAFVGKTAENGSLTLENLTLDPPEIYAANAANVGGVIGLAQVPVTIQKPNGAAETVKALTVHGVQYDIPGAANVGGVIGQATGAVTATGGLTLNNLSLDNQTRDKEDTTARTIGGVIGLATADVTLSGVELTKPQFTGGAGTNLGGVIGKADGAVRLTTVKVTDANFSNAANLGGVIGLAGTGSSVTLSGAEMVNPKLVGGTVGGLVGKADGNQVTISSGQLYMSESSYSAATTKLETVLDKWLVGGQYAGGLIGYAAGNVAVGKADGGVPSFAATVVNANATGILTRAASREPSTER
ncbi:MAG: hypothetical protein IKR84_05670, partial [Oscillibacter sp.]|nr:hypothetical protein [Oscillibacter sp.]